MLNTWSIRSVWWCWIFFRVNIFARNWWTHSVPDSLTTSSFCIGSITNVSVCDWWMNRLNVPPRQIVLCSPLLAVQHLVQDSKFNLSSHWSDDVCWLTFCASLLCPLVDGVTWLLKIVIYCISVFEMNLELLQCRVCQWLVCIWVYISIKQCWEWFKCNVARMTIKIVTDAVLCEVSAKRRSPVLISYSVNN